MTSTQQPAQQNQHLISANRKLSRIGTILAIVALSQLLVSLTVVMSVSPKTATLAASPIYAGAGITLLIAAIFIAYTLFGAKNLQRNPQSKMQQLRSLLFIGACAGLVLLLMLLIWGYFAGISFGALTLAAVIAVQGPLSLFIAQTRLQQQ